MPDPGRATHSAYKIELPKSQEKYPAMPWTCADATMVNVYFEVRKEVLLDRLISEYCRSSPAYCRLTVFDVPNSPVGPFRDAYLAMGCRLNMLPAAFVGASLTNNPAVMAAGIVERGYPNQLGKIDFESDINHARVALGDSAGAILELTLPMLQTIEPSRLAYDHVDAIRTKADGAVDLLVTGFDLAIERAAICKNATIEYPTERNDNWHALNCRNIVSAQVVHGTRTFSAGHPPR
jgi:hypothetical protein